MKITRSEFLSNYPLYKKCETDDATINPIGWVDETFQFHCDIENGIRTFKIVLPEFTLDFEMQRKIFRTEDNKSEYVQHFPGVCQSCQEFKVHFLIHHYSDVAIDFYNHPFNYGLRLRNPDSESQYNPKFFIKKIGQFPAFSIRPDKEIENFLEDLDKEYYSKALICLSQSYGIGAYSYFRRIVETEVIRIVDYLISLNLPENDKIQTAYQTYLSNHQMDSFLAKIDEYLPVELKSLHDHPLRLLYTELSLGIHQYDENECLKNAQITNDLLVFIIKALNSKRKNLDLSEKLKSLGNRTLPPKE